MPNLEDILFLDIETVSAKQHFSELNQSMQALWSKKALWFQKPYTDNAESYFDRAAIYAEFGKVIVIGMGIIRPIPNGRRMMRVKAISGHDESTLLKEFADFISSKFDQENLHLCAHNGKEFDIPFLCRRLMINGLSIPSSLDIRDKKPWETNHIDTMQLWKFGDIKSFTSLELLSSTLGIETSKTDMDGSMVNSAYYHNGDLDKITQYCCRDVVVAAQVYMKLTGNDLIPQDNILFVD